MERKRKGKGGTALLAGIAALLVAGATATASLAYFTTFAEAEGAREVGLQPGTELREDVNGLEKTIKIENTGEVDCYVRVKALAGDGTTLTYTGDSWTKKANEDGYWYYDAVLPVGETTAALTISIKAPDGGELDISSFNVVVVQECTPVLYDDEGKPHADWGMKAEGGSN